MDSIREEWDGIHADGSKSPLLSYEFVRLWYRCFSKPDEVRIYKIRDRDRTVGFLPLVLQRKAPFRVLSSLTNDHCLHSDPLVRRGYEGVFPELLLSSPFFHDKTWDAFVHRFSYSFSPFPGLFPDELLDSSGIRWERAIQPTYAISRNKPFEKYFKEDIKTSVRNSLKKDRRHLEQAGRYEFVHYQGAEIKTVWEDFLRIEDSGWKGEKGTSIRQADPEMRRYYEGLLDILAETGSSHLYFLRLNGATIAGAFGYVDKETFHGTKAAYDERFGSFSPSKLLILHLIEYFFTECPDLNKFHMFPWDFGYKHRFANTTASSIDTTIYNGTLRGRSLLRLSVLKRFIKRTIVSNRTFLRSRLLGAKSDGKS